MNKEWWYCPICGQKLLMINKANKIEGVYIKCKKCSKEVEVKNVPEQEREPTVA